MSQSKDFIQHLQFKREKGGEERKRRERTRGKKEERREREESRKERLAGDGEIGREKRGGKRESGRKSDEREADCDECSQLLSVSC